MNTARKQGKHGESAGRVINSTRKGNEKELRSAEIFTADGFVVGSRRHIGGPGDLLCVRSGGDIRGGRFEILLVEVKATTSPYAHFGKKNRKELFEFALENGCLPLLAYWPARARSHVLLAPAEWPSS